MVEGARSPQQYEALVEPVRHELHVVAEGHGHLLRELPETRADLQRRMETGFNDIQLGIKTLVNRVDAHNRAHAS